MFYVFKSTFSISIMHFLLAEYLLVLLLCTGELTRRDFRLAGPILHNSERTTPNDSFLREGLNKLCVETC